MESIATIVPRAMSSMAENNNHGRAPRTLFDLVERFKEQEEQHNPDVVVPMNELRMTPQHTIEVPGRGTYGFTDWSRRQMASMLGVRLDRWFENAGDIERAEEINRRLSRGTEKVKVRTTRELGDDVQADGTLRALVTPTYTPVADSEVGGLAIATLRPVDGEMKILRADVTDRTTSFVVAIGKPYKVGGDGVVGDIWGGVMVRNSGVGFASLLMVAHLLRLACLNGMVCPLPDAVLLRRRHRGINDDKLRWMLARRLHELPGMLTHAGETLRASTERQIDDVEAAVRGLLHESNLPLRMFDPIMDAYGREPMPTAFGISQAVTLAAQRFSPEERLQLEQAAGRYLPRE